jgi:hypothetical protein
MTMRRQCVHLFAPFAILAMATLVLAENPRKSSARLATFEKPTGETYFALSISPTESLPVADSNEVIVLIDTSASQSGAYRTQSLEVLAAFLKSLGRDDRVQLVAVDTRPVPLSAGFLAPDSPQMQAALAKLSRRAPLGATDLAKALEFVATAYPAESKGARSMVYLGDGMNKASYLAGARLSGLMQRLVSEQIAVSSCGIGNQRNVALLAAIANQTGGNYVAANPGDVKPQDAGAALAAVVQTPVAWPTNVKLPAQFTEVYPTALPPLRADRDTILVGLTSGAGDANITVEAVSNGEKVQFQWSPMAEPSNEDFAFLPKLVDVVKADGGVSLPTAGSQGLREAARFVMTGAEELAELGHKALASGDATGAQRAAELALKSDPTNVKAKLLAEVARKSIGRRPGTAAKSATAEPDLTLVRFVDDSEPGIERFDGGEGTLLDKVSEYRNAQGGRITAQVEEGLKDARQKLADGNSQVAVQDLKRYQDMLERAPDLDSDIKSDLLGKVSSAIREAQRRATIDQFREAEKQQKQAGALEQRRVLDEIANREQKITQMMARFISLMEEERYNDAERDVIPQIQQLYRGSTIAASSLWWADFSRNIDQMNDLVLRRNEMFNDTLYNVELAHVPFPDEPPIIYPSAEKWEDITIRRKKYKSVDLVKPGSAEENIVKELEKETKIDVIETPFSDVIKDIAKDHEITIVLDPEGMEEAGVTPDQLVTLNLKGISLRSAFRILLGPLHLTYTVKDEVLQITSEEKAGEQLVTKVYPVGDLVVPIINIPGGGGMGGMMGGMGGMGGGMGGMGGMGGGMGGMGGGMGGMGGGMGGMGGGGFFQVDPLPVAKIRLER